MTFKTFAAAGTAVALALTGATAFAQAPGAAPAPATTAQPAMTHGAAVPGVCVVSVDAAIVSSTVGKNAQQRLQQIATQVNAELQGERTAIQNDAKALEGQRNTLDANTLEQRAATLQVRDNAWQRKAQQRERELQVTQQKVRERLGQEVSPLLRTVYQQKQCSVLLDGAVVFANPAMDLTPQLVTALNAKITQFTIERERLDQPAPAAAAPAAPAAPRR